MPAVGGGIVGGAQPQTSYNFYDANSLLVRSLDPLGNYQDTGYDGLHRAVVSTRYTGSGTNGTALTSYTYYTDTARPQVTTIGPAPNFVRQDSISDEAGRLTSTTVYSGSAVSFPSLPASPLVTSYSYDGQGNRNSMSDPNGHLSVYGYENTGWLTSVAMSVTTPTGLQNLVTRYSYDRVGNRLTTTDANSHVVTTTYDVLNRPTIDWDGLGHANQSGYDGLGRLVKKLDADGQQSLYTYDNGGRLTLVVSSPTLGSTGATTPITTSYSYNTAGQMLVMRD